MCKIVLIRKSTTQNQLLLFLTCSITLRECFRVLNHSGHITLSQEGQRNEQLNREPSHQALANTAEVIPFQKVVQVDRE